MMTIMTTNVISLNLDLDSIQSRRDADLAASRVLKASCSEAERSYWLTEIQMKRREIERNRSSRRVPQKGRA